MTKKQEEINGTLIAGYIISFLLFCGFIFLVLNLAEEEYEKMEKINEYCKTQNYTGVKNMGKKLYSPDVYKCYKDIIHPSGIGVERQYSGEIK